MTTCVHLLDKTKSWAFKDKAALAPIIRGRPRPRSHSNQQPWKAQATDFLALIARWTPSLTHTLDLHQVAAERANPWACEWAVQLTLRRCQRVKAGLAKRCCCFLTFSDLGWHCSGCLRKDRERTCCWGETTAGGGDSGGKRKWFVTFP